MTGELQIDTEREIRPEFTPYLRMLGFLGAVLGPNAEIVLHDISDLSRSIIALVNGAVSGRKVGGPATDLVLKIVQNREYQQREHVSNYLSRSGQGKLFRSSTYFIRDEKGDPVGMLCINIDDSVFNEARQLLERLTQTTGILKGESEPASAGADMAGARAVRALLPHRGENSEVSERLSTSVDELTLEAVSEIVARGGIDPRRMTQDERRNVVRELDAAGVFLLKGAVAHTAATLQVSEPSVYRYLKQVRE